MNKVFENQIRVRYGETDQMGFVYYGNYALFLEVARTELLRDLNLSYAKLEEEGIQLPVVNLNINYRSAAKYDDLLSLKTVISGIISKKICFQTSIYNAEEKLVCEAEVTLVFVDKNKQRVITCPTELNAKLAKYQCL